MFKIAPPVKKDIFLRWWGVLFSKPKTMKTIKIYRHWQDRNQTLGNVVVFDEENKPLFGSMLVERGWRDNEKGESCIPEGEYYVYWEMSERFKRFLWEVKGVPGGRTECKFHPANSWHQLNGCFAPGIKLKDIDNDGYIDVTESRNTLEWFHKALKGETKALLIIKNSF